MPKREMPLIEEDDVRAAEQFPDILPRLHDRTVNALIQEMRFNYFSHRIRYAFKEFYESLASEVASRSFLSSLRTK